MEMGTAFILLGIFLVIVIFRYAIWGDDEQPQSPPISRAAASAAAPKRQTQAHITPQMLYRWEKQGENYVLFFAPDFSSVTWKLNDIYLSASSILPIATSKGKSIENISIKSEWGRTLGYDVALPTAVIDGYAVVESSFVGGAGGKLEDGVRILLLSPTKPLDPYLPVEITDEMVFRWRKIDPEEFRLIFEPSGEACNIEFKCKRNHGHYQNHYYNPVNGFKVEVCVNTVGYRQEYNRYKTIADIPKWVCPPYLNEFGADYVYKISTSIPQFGSTPLLVGQEVATVYLGSKAAQCQIEQKRIEEMEKQREREKAEAEERERMKRKIKARQRKRDLEKQVRQEMLDSGELYGEQMKRPHIPREVVDAVYRRDGGRCVYCGSVENLHLDHIIPFSRGGATNVENLQLLCQKCNLEKSNKIG